MAEVSPGWDRSSGCARGATHCSLWSSSSRANSTIPKRLSGPQNGPQSIEHGRVLNGRRHSFVAAVGDAAHGLTQNLSRTGLRQRGDDVDDPETRHSAPNGEIEGRKLSAVSMMPDGLLQTLSNDQVRQLLAYLMGPDQTPLPEANPAAGK